ncbi:MAG: response regulator [Candidatus Zixiibacteriota bacterium]
MDKQLCILTIDDEQIVLDSVQKHLKRENYELLFALSARDALAKLDKQSVDIVLTDLMMPEIDGLEFLELIKKRSPQTPVIMITGYATISSALQATNLGAFDYIAKPFTKAELLSVVNRAAQLVRAAQSRPGDLESQNHPDNPPIAGKSGEHVIGEYGWNCLQDDGTVVLGVGKNFLDAIGKIQNIFLPSRGDELRQGSVYLRIFSADLRSHVVLSPLSGTVADVNERVTSESETGPRLSSEDWLVRLKPSKFELEVRDLGL